MTSSNDNYKLRENCDKHSVRFITAVSLLFQSLVYSTFGKKFYYIQKNIFDGQGDNSGEKMFPDLAFWYAAQKNEVFL